MEPTGAILERAVTDLAGTPQKRGAQEGQADANSGQTVTAGESEESGHTVQSEKILAGLFVQRVQKWQRLFAEANHLSRGRFLEAAFDSTPFEEGASTMPKKSKRVPPALKHGMYSGLGLLPTESRAQIPEVQKTNIRGTQSGRPAGGGHRRRNRSFGMAPAKFIHL